LDLRCYFQAFFTLQMKAFDSGIIVLGSPTLGVMSLAVLPVAIPW
jgi:hypothetical protein